MKGMQIRTTPAVAHARQRKLLSRDARNNALTEEAASLGINVDELKRRKFMEVEAIRKNPPSLRDWLMRQLPNGIRQRAQFREQKERLDW